MILSPPDLQISNIFHLRQWQNPFWQAQDYNKSWNFILHFHSSCSLLAEMLELKQRHWDMTNARLIHKNPSFVLLIFDNFYSPSKGPIKFVLKEKTICVHFFAVYFHFPKRQWWQNARKSFLEVPGIQHLMCPCMCTMLDSNIGFQHCISNIVYNIVPCICAFRRHVT